MGGYIALDPTDIPSHQFAENNLTIFLVFTILCIILLQYAISLYVKKGVIPQVLFPALLIVSYPFALTSLRVGNSVLIVAALMGIALQWRNDPSKIKRELAMILIAVCAGLKIYPAIFGLMYLKERRWKETVRLVIYGVVLFFAPFAFFGGIDGLRSFIQNLIGLDYAYYSVSGLTEMLTYHFLGDSIPALTFAVQQCFLLFSVIAFFLCREKWGEVLILCCVMAFYISSSLTYTSVYMLPAMLMFFYEKTDQPIKITKRNWGEIVGFFLFLITFTIPYKINTSINFLMIPLDVLYLLSVLIGFIMDKKTTRKRI